MNALAETAVLGETFLADVQRQNAETKLDEGIPGMVGKVQELLSGDFEALGAYDPTKAKLSFPEIQESARTEIIDFRGKKLPTVGFSISLPRMAAGRSDGRAPKPSP